LGSLLLLRGLRLIVLGLISFGLRFSSPASSGAIDNVLGLLDWDILLLFLRSIFLRHLGLHRHDLFICSRRLLLPLQFFNSILLFLNLLRFDFLLLLLCLHLLGTYLLLH